MEFSKLINALDFSPLVPPTFAQWRPLLEAGIRFFLQRLPANRLIGIVEAQSVLPDRATTSERLVALLSQCPTLHKLGQVLARNKQLPLDIRLALQTLESMLPTTPIASVQARIAEELPHNLPVNLAPQALAEGSVAVVLPFRYQENHQTLDGVFKVLKPGIEEKLTEELAIWNPLGVFLDTHGHHLGLPALDYRGTLESVRVLLTQEICLKSEQDHLRAAADFYADEPRILIPRVLPWCTPSITAMERVFGEKITEANLSVNHRACLAETLVTTLIGQPFWSPTESVMVHADLHAGNIFVTADQRLAILDWSLVAPLSKALREALVAIVLGGLTLDAKKIRDALANLGTTDTDNPALHQTIEQALDRIVLQGQHPGFGWLLALLDELAQHAAIHLNGNLILFRKTWSSLAGVIADLIGEHSPDLPLLNLNLQRLWEEMPERLLTSLESRHFATHISNADILRLYTSAWTIPMDYWVRFWLGQKT